jgi:hypothetical protein
VGKSISGAGAKVKIDVGGLRKDDGWCRETIEHNELTLALNEKNCSHCSGKKILQVLNKKTQSFAYYFIPAPPPQSPARTAPSRHGSTAAP